MSDNEKNVVFNKKRTIILSVVGIVLLVFMSSGITIYAMLKNPHTVINLSEKYFNKEIRKVEKEIVVKKINQKWFELKQDVITDYFISVNQFLPEDEARRYAKAVMKSANTFKVDPFLVTSIIVKESTVNYMARSSVAHGLMQIHWGVHKKAILNAFGSKVEGIRDIYVPETNIDIGTWILSNYIQSVDGDIRKALGKYYGKQDSNYINDILDRYLNIISDFYGKASLDVLNFDEGDFDERL